MVTVDFYKRGISIQAKQKMLHGPSEKIFYTLLLSPWSLQITGTPTILKVVDVLIPGTNLASTLFPSGAASVDNDEVLLPLMQDLTLGITYRVHVNFSDSSNTWEATFLVDCRN